MTNPISKWNNFIKSKLPPLPTTPPTHELDRTTLLQLGLIIGIAIILHFTIANVVIAGFALVIFSLKLAAIWFQKKSPASFIMALLLVFSIGLVVFFYGGWNGQIAGISFIVLLVSLKFLESRLLRDYYVVCILLYFLAASSFLFNSSIFNVIFVTIYTIAITCLLFKISTPSDISFKFTLRESCKIILKALPLTIFLFFFFPRIHGNFGFLPSQDQGNTPSLSDSLVAGEMAFSAFNNSIAFRAQFDGETPPPEQRYWRSKVMTIERNFQWEVVNINKRDAVSGQKKADALNLDNGRYHYQILHEPSKDTFIPYLDYPSGINKGKIQNDYSVFDDKSKDNIFSYRGSSSIEPSLPTSITLNEAQLLNTESLPSARIQALISQWRSTTTDPQELVNIVYTYFNDNPFYYSLAPPFLDEENRLDDFIFNSQTGYCEHYASAFTILMRWMGIPARVVVGYQGGKLNTAGNYLEVRYSDAHAWSEVYINQQWQRVDPTSAVSPERIEFGMDALAELWDGNAFSNATGQALSDFLNPSGAAYYFQKMSDSWNNISYQWNKWVVNYDQKKQQDLLKNIGFEHKNSLLLLASIISVGVMAFLLFYFWQLIPKPMKLDELQKAYYLFTNKFKKHGITRLAGDTPKSFGIKAKQKFPAKTAQINAIIDSYETLRYGRKSKEYTDLIEQFKQHVKKFKLTSKP